MSRFYSCFIMSCSALAIACVLPAPPTMAQNLNQKFGGSWNCNRLSSTTQAMRDLYLACKPCDDKGLEFYQDSPSSGHCVSRGKESGSGNPSGTGNVAKGRLQEKDGDEDFKNGDWLGASISYEAALKHYGGGSDATRVDRKKRSADCKYTMERSRKAEDKGDIRMAISALNNAGDSCDNSNVDIAAELERLRGQMASSTRPSALRNESSVDIAPVDNTPSSAEPDKETASVCASQKTYEQKIFGQNVACIDFSNVCGAEVVFSFVYNALTISRNLRVSVEPGQKANFCGSAGSNIVFSGAEQK